MERSLNAENCKMSSLLKSVNMESVHPKLVRKCVTLDTLLNLTPEDLDYLEITDPSERDMLLNNFKLYQSHFDDILNPPPFNRTKMLVTSIQQLKAINSLTSTMLSQVSRLDAASACCNRLVDDVTPVSKLISLFTSQALRSIHLIESDISNELEKTEGRKWRWASSKGLPMVLLAGSLGVVTILAWDHLKQANHFITTFLTHFFKR